MEAEGTGFYGENMPLNIENFAGLREESFARARITNISDRIHQAMLESLREYDRKAAELERQMRNYIELDTGNKAACQGKLW